MLSVDDFDGFFLDVHGVTPFPWQRRLLRYLVDHGKWPAVLDLPTGSGKTAAMDIAVFHLAYDLARGDRRTAPIRIAFVVDRRLVVDDAYGRALKLARALDEPETKRVANVAAQLQKLAGDATPLIARALRGGIPREDDWARTPAQPTILCSTVDQVGSRLLFRGYGVSDSMKPVHAGLLGADCLILLDEAHLAEPFRQTLGWVRHYRDGRWRETDDASPWETALLTATPWQVSDDGFTLDDEDLKHPVLRARLEASKPARLVLYARGRDSRSEVGNGAGGSAEAHELHGRVDALAAEARDALDHFAGEATPPAIGVVVNRVARARSTFDALRRQHSDADVRLLIGPSRPVDREQVAAALQPIRTGATRSLERPLIIVATQCIEAGVDIDLDGLITEAAPLDSLRQRFGRLNRAGRDITPYAAIIAWKSDVAARYEDPVYGKAIKAAWDRLNEHATGTAKRKTVDFGILAFNVPFERDALTPAEDAPILLPAHLDLLQQTSPVPAVDPEVAFFLHGSRREPDSVRILWRADITPEDPAENVRSLLTLIPPRAAEAIELPIWTVRRWLRSRRDSVLAELADISTSRPDEENEAGDTRLAFRWRGDDDRSEWIAPWQIRRGDTIVVPARDGGVDEFGWNPGSASPASDVAAQAAHPFAGRRFAVRVAPGLIGEVKPETLTDALAGAESLRPKDIITTLLDLELPPELTADLNLLERARKNRVIAHTDVYSRDGNGRVRGVVFVAPHGIATSGRNGAAPPATEDDLSGSLTGIRVPLLEHTQAVAEMAVSLGSALGLNEQRIRDLEAAGLLHDLGKADLRFQAWLYHGDPLGPDPAEEASVLAKSGRNLPPTARAAAGLPERWRHEALSVRLAPNAPGFANAADPELVLWLIGTHHGRGRVLFPHTDPADAAPRRLPAVAGLPDELPPGAGPQSLSYEWNGTDWPGIHNRVRARYGPWELALLEAILRLADHRVSDDEARRETS